MCTAQGCQFFRFAITVDTRGVALEVRAPEDARSIVGVGIAACAACCAGPIIGVLAAIGLGTAVTDMRTRS